MCSVIEECQHTESHKVCKHWRIVTGKSGRGVKVPCGYCRTCLINKKQQWIFRLQQEEKISTSSYFVTLTYNDANLPITGEGIPTLAPDDLTKYMKRLRKREKGNDKIRYYSVGEYGTKNHRPHYHLILLNVKNHENITKAWSNYDVHSQIHHSKGIVHIGSVTNASIAYTLSYIFNKPQNKGIYDKVREFSRQSKGIGKNYLTPEIVKYHRDNLEIGYVQMPGGTKVGIPRYYKDKMFTEKDFIEREKIAAANAKPTAWDKYNKALKSKGSASRKQTDAVAKYIRNARGQLKPFPKKQKL